MWITTDDVITFTGLKPKHLNLDQDDTEGLDDIISVWIEQSSDLINNYTNRDYDDDTVTAAVQNVCLRLTSNMVTLAIQKRDSPIIKVNDWSIQSIGSEIFTDDLKNDLTPFVKDTSSDYNMFGVYAITGAPEEDTSSDDDSSSDDESSDS